MGTVPQEILARLDALAAKLGTVASHLWAVLTKQAYIEGITDLVWGGLWLVFALVDVGVVIYAFRSARGWQRAESDAEGAWAGLAVAGIIAIPILVFCCVTISLDGTQQLLNPEFFALHKLAELFR